MSRCLAPSCPKKATTRGLCHSHYQSALRLVNLGRITWSKLERAGKAIPPAQRPADYFLAK
jgi:hypothetical protein